MMTFIAQDTDTYIITVINILFSLLLLWIYGEKHSTIGLRDATINYFHNWLIRKLFSRLISEKLQKFIKIKWLIVLFFSFQQSKTQKLKVLCDV